MHVVGIVGSIAIPVFLAVQTRFASRHARFFFHEYGWTYTQCSAVTRSTMDEHSMLLGSALNLSKEMIKARTALSDSSFDMMKLFYQPFLMDAGSAAEHGLVSAIIEPAIPRETQPRIIV